MSQEFPDVLPSNKNETAKQDLRYENQFFSLDTLLNKALVMAEQRIPQGHAYVDDIYVDFDKRPVSKIKFANISLASSESQHTRLDSELQEIQVIKKANQTLDTINADSCKKKRAHIEKLIEIIRSTIYTKDISENTPNEDCDSIERELLKILAEESLESENSRQADFEKTWPTVQVREATVGEIVNAETENAKTAEAGDMIVTLESGQVMLSKKDDFSFDFQPTETPGVYKLKG